MNDIMSFQYHPPGTPPPPYNGVYPIAPHMTGSPTLAGLGMRSPHQPQPGRNASPSMSLDLKRANSHPNIKMDHASEDSTMVKSSDKGKKKTLGYHRAPAACTSCRRRKIRCHPGEPGQEKCVTCHKLNKDCKFESVNSGSPTESRHGSMSRASAVHRLASASSSSSPAVQSGHPIDMHGHHHGSMTMPPIHQMGLDSPGLKIESGINRYPDYGSQGMATNWMAPDSATPSSSRNESKHGSWAHTPYETTPMTPNFPPYHANNHSHHAPPTPQHTWANTTAGGASEPQSAAWSAYPPSASSGFSPLTSNFVDRSASNKTSSVMPPAEMYPPITSGFVDRSASNKTSSGMSPAEMYPPIPTMDHHAPLSPPPPGSAPSGGYGAWQTQQPHQAYPPIKQESGGAGGGYPGPTGGTWYA